MLARLDLCFERSKFRIDSPVLAAERQKLPFPSVVVVEIKRPMRKDATEGKNPIQQCLDNVTRIRAGGIKTAMGRLIPPTQDLPTLCYIIADLTEKMIERWETSDLRPTHDGARILRLQQRREDVHRGHKFRRTSQLGYGT